MRGATPEGCVQVNVNIFQSTLLMRGATGRKNIARIARKFQSTLLMRGATLFRDGADEKLMISIHAPHARSDYYKAVKHHKQITFQSTLLMRGATRIVGPNVAVRIISIHAPHARSDPLGCSDRGHPEYFNPRSSCEERPGR